LYKSSSYVRSQKKKRKGEQKASLKAIPKDTEETDTRSTDAYGNTAVGCGSVESLPLIQAGHRNSSSNFDPTFASASMHDEVMSIDNPSHDKNCHDNPNIQYLSSFRNKQVDELSIPLTANDAAAVAPYTTRVTSVTESKDDRIASQGCDPLSLTTAAQNYTNNSDKSSFIEPPFHMAMTSATTVTTKEELNDEETFDLLLQFTRSQTNNR
jgi:predicted DNA-binding protein (MmcQ/YjbR family)